MGKDGKNERKSEKADEMAKNAAKAIGKIFDMGVGIIGVVNENLGGAISEDDLKVLKKQKKAIKKTVRDIFEEIIPKSKGE